MKYAWKLPRLRHLIFNTDRPMALDRRNRRIRGKVASASPKIVVLKTSQGTRRLSRTVWTIAPIEEARMPEYVPALLKGFAARNRQRRAEKT
jgi:hypothetical protein